MLPDVTDLKAIKFPPQINSIFTLCQENTRRFLAITEINSRIRFPIFTAKLFVNKKKKKKKKIRLFFHFVPDVSKPFSVTHPNDVNK